MTASAEATAVKKADTTSSLRVLLTVPSSLTSISRDVLISEAERIWRHELVRIEFARPGDAPEPPDSPLRVLVVSRPQFRPRTTGNWPLAELQFEAAPRALAIASIAGAERVVDEATRSSGRDLRFLREHRIGLVLGRAIAHEIGHFLLATGTHAESGLMRASINAREFAAVDGGTFRLDREASQWLRHRLALSSPAETAVRAAGFSYVRAPVLLEQIPD